MLARQLLEVEAVCATFPEPGAVQLAPAEAAALEQARALADSADGAAAAGPAAPQLSGVVVLPDCQLGGRPVGLRFSLPAGYPDAQPPALAVACDAPRAAHDQLTAVVDACVAENRGGEVLLLALDALRAAAAAQQAEAPAEAAGDGGSGALAADQQPPPCLARCLLWFHHIKALGKRRALVSWAGELRLRGFSKPGFPGVVVCEGAEADVQEYCSRVKGLHWQAVAVRAEEREAAAGALPWRLPPGFRELGEGEMHVLAAECRAAGLGHFVAAALKL